MAGAAYWTYLGIHAVSLLINGALAVWVWRRDFGRSGRYFLVALVVGLCYGVAGGAMIAQRSTRFAPFIFPVLGTLSWASTVAWFAFVLQYTGRGHLLTRRTVAGLVGVVAAMAVLLLTNPIHGAVYAGYELVSVPYTHAEPVEASLWYVLTPLGYLVGLGSIGLLVVTTLRARNVSRRQALLLSGVFVATTILSAVLRAGVRSIPPSLGGVIFNASLAYALSREQMLTVEPLTRTVLMESMNDALVAVTDEELVVDFNDAAAELFPDLPEGVGDPLGEAAPVLAGGLSDPPEEVVVETDEGSRTLAVDVDEIQQHGTRGHVVILRDVTEIEAYAADLERQTEQLDQFASVVSHDLRNPLNVATLYLSQLKRRTDADEAERALESLERMDELIDAGLTLAREGQVVEDPDPVSVELVARNAWQFVDAPEATLETELEGLVIAADEERLQTLFENLFRNSVEHGSTSSRPEADDTVENAAEVTVSVYATEDGFRVGDDGPGIPDDRKDEVLQKGVTTSDSGTGLGLSIVGSIARAHGWTISVEDSVDGGAAFGFGGVRVVDPPAKVTAPYAADAPKSATDD